MKHRCVENNILIIPLSASPVVELNLKNLEFI